MTDDRLREQQRHNDLKAFLTMSSASETPMPVCKIRTLEDGCVRVQVGDGPGAFVGVVSSMHLVEPKCLQLQQYWTKAQAANGITTRHQV